MFRNKRYLILSYLILLESTSALKRDNIILLECKCTLKRGNRIILYVVCTIRSGPITGKLSMISREGKSSAKSTFSLCINSLPLVIKLNFSNTIGPANLPSLIGKAQRINKKSMKTPYWLCKSSLLHILARQKRPALPISTECNAAPIILSVVSV
jgi:hypothetical protein